MEMYFVSHPRVITHSFNIKIDWAVSKHVELEGGSTRATFSGNIFSSTTFFWKYLQ